jgi:hypothetical protein
MRMGTAGWLQGGGGVRGGQPERNLRIKRKGVFEQECVRRLCYIIGRRGGGGGGAFEREWGCVVGCGWVIGGQRAPGGVGVVEEEHHLRMP